LYFNAGTFLISAKNIDLSGLYSPIVIDISFGAYSASASADESVINKKKPIPITLMTHNFDALRIDKATHKSASSGDSLTLSGGIVVADPTLDLTTEDFTLTWGDSFTETIGATGFTNKKGNYTYKKPQDSLDYISSAVLNLTKGTFKIAIKKAPDLDDQFPVTFGLTFGTFTSTATYPSTTAVINIPPQEPQITASAEFTADPNILITGSAVGAATVEISSNADFHPAIQVTNNI
ncbi:MAG: hypothetical protein GY869_00480, partial [Planctomycetes bacterium]|nr:hypothetical protein [Planctomycetota bacterium]